MRGLDPIPLSSTDAWKYPLRQGCLCTIVCKDYTAIFAKMQPQKKAARASGPGGGGIYLPKVLQQRMRMVAIWARLAVPWGIRVSAVTPWTMPLLTAQPKASRA